MKKLKKSLPVLTITDEINGHHRRYIPIEYIITVLQGLEIVSMTMPNSLLTEIRRLRGEIENSGEPAEVEK